MFNSVMEYDGAGVISFFPITMTSNRVNAIKIV